MKAGRGRRVARDIKTENERMRWWEREFCQVLTGNSSVWWVNTESAKSHYWHHLTSPSFCFHLCSLSVNSKQSYFTYTVGHKHKSTGIQSSVQTGKWGTETAGISVGYWSLVKSVNLLLSLWWRCPGLPWFKMPAGALHSSSFTLLLSWSFSPSP